MLLQLGTFSFHFLHSTLTDRNPYAVFVARGRFSVYAHSSTIQTRNAHAHHHQRLSIQHNAGLSLGVCRCFAHVVCFAAFAANRRESRCHLAGVRCCDWSKCIINNNSHLINRSTGRPANCQHKPSSLFPSHRYWGSLQR